jgi:hypothetical protein
MGSMNVTLSWDLVVIVFFGVIMSYSFIIGKHESVKIIVFTYIAIVAGLATGNVLTRLSANSQPLLSSFGLVLNITVLDSTKLLIFIGTIILLAIRGGFDVAYGNDDSGITNTILTGLFGFVTAGLLLTTLLTFVAGGQLLSPALSTAPNLAPILAQSQLMQAMVLYQDLWFVLPAALLVTVGIVSGSKE